MVEQCLVLYGGIDVLQNNVGIVVVEGSEEISAEAWSRLISVNVKSMFLTARESSYRDNRQDNMRWPFLIVIDGIGCDDRFFRASVNLPNIQVPIKSWEIAAGYAHPDPVTLFENVAGRPEVYRNRSDFSWFQWNRVQFGHPIAGAQNSISDEH